MREMRWNGTIVEYFDCLFAVLSYTQMTAVIHLAKEKGNRSLEYTEQDLLSAPPCATPLSSLIITEPRLPLRGPHAPQGVSLQIGVANATAM